MKRGTDRTRTALDEMTKDDLLVLIVAEMDAAEVVDLLINSYQTQGDAARMSLADKEWREAAGYNVAEARIVLRHLYRLKDDLSNLGPFGANEYGD